MTSSSGAGTFDPDALRAKYAEERRRRLRADGISQYVQVTGAFREFGDDPWADPDFTRDPITDAVDVAVVGAGFGGLLIGARCKQLGVDNVRLI
ncbi:MAG: monooxygenase, partial [Mycobacterium sp.]